MDETIPETQPAAEKPTPQPAADENTLLLQSLLPEGTQERKRVMTALLRGLLNEAQNES